jgi:hypothetical protein
MRAPTCFSWQRHKKSAGCTLLVTGGQNHGHAGFRINWLNCREGCAGLGTQQFVGFSLSIGHDIDFKWSSIDFQLVTPMVSNGH